MLLRHGADPSLGSDEIGTANTCVHAAVAHRDLGVLHLLLRHGAAHSAPGKGGLTPLAAAARAGAVVVIEPLLRAGAEPHTRTQFGKSAYELAVINKRAEAITMFDSWEAEAPTGGDPKRVKR